MSADNSKTKIPSEPAIESSVISEDSSAAEYRYLAYASRLRSLALASSKFTRYAAYTSDLGEAFRPVVPPWAVRAAYGVSWAYVLTDVAIETKNDYDKGRDTTELTRTALKRGLFQSIASMALPALTIHQTVHLFSAICQKTGRFQKWGPTVAGLAVVPALPFLFDEPVEHAIDYAFRTLWPSPFDEAKHEHKSKDE